MLFLLNDRITDVAVPEMHLQQRWRDMGCGDPYRMKAQDAIEFAESRIAHHLFSQTSMDDDEVRDLAAMIIAKTGANCFILKPTPSGEFEPRLQHMPTMVLETYMRGAANDAGHGSVLPSQVEA